MSNSTTRVAKRTSGYPLQRYAVICLIGVASILGFARASAATEPNQFIAKMYTEALGRGPDQAAWGNFLDYFRGNGCSQSTLKAVGHDFYLSAEFGGLGYDNPARLLTLYRGVLNREPDSAGFDVGLQMLATGTPWVDLVDGAFDSAEFASLIASICSGGPYYYGTFPAITLPTSGSGFGGGTGAELQQALDSQPAGGTVFLAQKAVVRVTGAPIVLRNGKKIQTTGAPSPNSYALMGRIVREGATGPLVEIESGQLLNVWVDGQRGHPDNFFANANNVVIYGGANNAVRSSKVSNSRGWTTLVALGTQEMHPACSALIISGNLVTAYSSDHSPGSLDQRWTDGITVSCEDAVIEFNTVIDATDVGIILFSSEPATQRSKVRFNTVLNAANSAYAGLAAEHRSDPAGEVSFTGTRVHNNTLWTGTTAHIDIGLSVGTVAWWGPERIGRGAQFDTNTSGSQTIRTDVAIGVSGMLDANVNGNTFSVESVDVSDCPNAGGTVNVGVDEQFASGTIQSYQAVQLNECIRPH